MTQPQSSVADPFRWRDPNETLTRGEFVIELLSLLDISRKVAKKHRDAKFESELETAINVIHKSFAAEELMDFEKLEKEYASK